MPTLSYYLIAYLDVLGQSQRLRHLKRLPKTDEEKQHMIETLASTALTIKNLRESFDHHFGYDAPSREAVDMIPPQHQDEFRQALSLQPWYRGFSDSVVITVPLAGREEVQHVAALMAVHRALYAVGAVSLNFFSTLGAPIRGGIDVGLGVEVFEREYYGRALVEAYLLERDQADYPRVLIGSTLLDYLAAVDGATFSSPRLEALAKSTVRDCRELILSDPEDGLPAVDPLWITGDAEDPHHKEYALLGSQMLHRANNLMEQFRQRGDEKLARRYERLKQFLSTSPHAPQLTA